MSANISQSRRLLAVWGALLLVCTFGTAVAADKNALPQCPSAGHKAYACAYAYCFGDKKKCSVISKVTPHCPICVQEVAACNHAIRKAINSRPMEPGYFACQ